MCMTLERKAAYLQQKCKNVNRLAKRKKENFFFFSVPFCFPRMLSQSPSSNLLIRGLIR